MLVSVIIPNYNHGQFLRQRIDSILNQSYQNLELIILDDCSSDDSREIIETYRKDSRVTNIIYNETNSGSVFTQWQKGIALAKGELIWIAESDDFCEVSFLKELTNCFEQHERLVIAYVQSILFDGNRIIWRTQSEYLEEYLDGRSFLAKYMLGSCRMLNASAVVFKKDAFLQITDEFTNYRQCGDWRFWCEIAGLGDVMVLGKDLNYFRRHVANTTSKNSKDGLYYLEGAEIIKYLIKIHQYSKDTVREQVKKMVIQLDNEKDQYGKDLFDALMKKVVSIDPEIIGEIQASILRQRQKEKIKDVIKKVIGR